MCSQQASPTNPAARLDLQQKPWAINVKGGGGGVVQPKPKPQSSLSETLETGTGAGAGGGGGGGAAAAAAAAAAGGGGGGAKSFGVSGDVSKQGALPNPSYKVKNILSKLFLYLFFTDTIEFVESI